MKRLDKMDKIKAKEYFVPLVLDTGYLYRNKVIGKVNYDIDYKTTPEISTTLPYKKCVNIKFKD